MGESSACIWVVSGTRLNIHDELIPTGDPVARPMSSLLQDNLITPILGIDDPRRVLTSGSGRRRHPRSGGVGERVDSGD